MNKNNVCNNCGKQGHLFHQCKLPIISYGLIVFKKIEEEIKYLMIRRKDSFGYTDFIRGKYVPTNLKQLELLFNEMTVEEKQRILTHDFDTLWNTMWGTNIDNLSAHYKNEESISKKKYESLKGGINIGINDKIITLENIVNNSCAMWKETEWGFPKGRRNQLEKDIDCAIREFEEETGILKNNIKLIENLLPFEEIFIGSNNKPYKHKYFLARADNIEYNLNNYQKTEVSKLEWKPLEKCLEDIRPYNLEKKTLIMNIDLILKNYNVF
jgi:8-oxo-dGTP pyrophosphatase MutT (NUDIX family)